MFEALAPELSSAAEGQAPLIADHTDWIRNHLETKASCLTPKLLNAVTKYLFPQDFPVDVVSEHGAGGEKS